VRLDDIHDLRYPVGSKNASSSVAFPAEDVSSIMVDFEGPELASTLRNLRHSTILEQTDSFHPVLVNLVCILNVSGTYLSPWLTALYCGTPFSKASELLGGIVTSL
jgi:hypothetical protein